jgi:hypothetical protein
MKSIKTNPNSAKGPDKGKIVNTEHFISIKHRILATFNINKKKINSDSLYAFKNAFSHRDKLILCFTCTCEAHFKNIWHCISLHMQIIM